MTEEEKIEPEQITKVPEDIEKKPVKVKDPKKVAAGKALAKKNVEARKALKKQEDGFSLGDVANNIRNLGFTIGAGFTIYHGYRVLFPKEEEIKHEAIETNDIEEKPEEKPTEPIKEKEKEKVNIDMD